jgi:hypothetical protein
MLDKMATMRVRSRERSSTRRPCDLANLIVTIVRQRAAQVADGIPLGHSENRRDTLLDRRRNHRRQHERRDERATEAEGRRDHQLPAMFRRERILDDNQKEQERKRGRAERGEEDGPSKTIAHRLYYEGAGSSSL